MGIWSLCSLKLIRKALCSSASLRNVGALQGNHHALLALLHLLEFCPISGKVSNPFELYRHAGVGVGDLDTCIGAGRGHPLRGKRPESPQDPRFQAACIDFQSCRWASAKHFRRRKEFACSPPFEMEASDGAILPASKTQTPQHKNVTGGFRSPGSTRIKGVEFLEGDVLSNSKVDTQQR
jgi:hypothetical protein